MKFCKKIISSITAFTMLLSSAAYLPEAQPALFSLSTAASAEDTEKTDLTLSANTAIFLEEDEVRNYGTINLGGYTLTVKGGGTLNADKIHGGPLIVNSGNINVGYLNVHSYTQSDGVVSITGSDRITCYSINISGGTFNSIPDIYMPCGGIIANCTAQINGDISLRCSLNMYDNVDVVMNGNITQTNTPFGEMNIDNTTIVVGVNNGSITVGENTVVNGNITCYDNFKTYPFSSPRNLSEDSTTAEKYTTGASVYIKGGTVNGDVTAGKGGYYNYRYFSGNNYYTSYRQAPDGDVYVESGLLNGSILYGYLRMSGGMVKTSSLYSTSLDYVTGGILNYAGDITMFGTQSITEGFTVDKYSTLTMHSNADVTLDNAKLIIYGSLTNNGVINVGEGSSIAGSGKYDAASTGKVYVTTGITDEMISVPSDAVYSGIDRYGSITLNSTAKGTYNALGGIPCYYKLKNSTGDYTSSLAYEGGAVTSATNAGVYDVTYTNKNDSSEKASASFEIAKKEITIAGIDIEDKYCNNAVSAVVSDVLFNGLIGSEKLTLGVDYTATASFATSKVGECFISGKVTLLNTAKANNYKLADNGIFTAYEVNNAIMLAQPKVTASEGEFKATLSWAAVPGAESYNVYETAGGTSTLLGNVTACKYDVSIPVYNKEHKYYVIAVCGDHQSAYDSSCIVSVTLKEKNGHSYEYDDIVPANCSQEGTRHYHCIYCGDEYMDVVSPTGIHSYTAAITAPTCTEQGYTTYTCTVCGSSYVDNIKSAAGHKPVSANNAVAVTCTTAGKESDTKCSVCGETLTTGKTIPATGHDPVSANNAVAVTCTTAGKESDTKCSVCGETLTTGKTIPATGHKPVSANNGKAATCTEAGKESDTKCSVCGVTLTTGKTIAATGHRYGTPTYTWASTNKSCTASCTCTKCRSKNNEAGTVTVTTTDATCTKDGSTIYTAKFTNTAFTTQTKTVTTAATGHKSVSANNAKAATCTEAGKESDTRCSVCGATLTTGKTIAAKGHSYGAWTTITVTSCTVNGTQTRTCTACGIKETKVTSATGHKYNDKIVAPTYSAQGYTLHTCSVCNDSYKDNYKSKLTINVPTGIKQTKNTANSVTVSWSAVKDATNYTVQIYKGGKWVSNTVKTTSYTFTGLSKSTKYNIKVRANVGTASGSYSSNMTICTALNTVSGLKATAKTGATLTLGWNAVSGADDYEIAYYIGGKWVTKKAGGKTSYKITGLTQYTNYNVKVRALTNAAGSKTVYGGYSSVAKATTSLSEPTSVKVAGRATDAIRLSWAKNSSANGYIVEMYKDGKWVRAAKITSNSTTQYKKSGLSAGTTYKFRIRSYRTSGSTVTYSSYTNISACTNPAKITGLKISGKGPDALRIAWSKNSKADGYIVEMYSGSGWTRVAKITSNSTVEYKKTGLKSNSTYKFRVKAYKTDGSAAAYSAYSSTVSGTTTKKSSSSSNNNPSSGSNKPSNSDITGITNLLNNQLKATLYIPNPYGKNTDCSITFQNRSTYDLTFDSSAWMYDDNKLIGLLSAFKDNPHNSSNCNYGEFKLPTNSKATVKFTEPNYHFTKSTNNLPYLSDYAVAKCSFTINGVSGFFVFYVDAYGDTLVEHKEHANG